MKMSKWFESEIRLHGDIIECDDFAYAEMSCEYVVDGIDAGVAICHAVNNHDRMADEIADLREALQSALNIESLWLPKANMITHTDEFCALHKMHDNFKKLLNK